MILLCLYPQLSNFKSKKQVEYHSGGLFIFLFIVFASADYLYRQMSQEALIL